MSCRSCRTGPIPAGAGEPSDFLSRDGSCGAYPRGRGGTSVMLLSRALSHGLSPRARGNPVLCHSTLFLNGPIPAGAGEPPRCSAWQTCTGAYPRGRGGTACSCSRRRSEAGLSPRARGNRLAQAECAGCRGPIPAGAGEPAPHAAHRGARGAYPRGRGGTKPRRSRSNQPSGLSPRARGNRECSNDRIVKSGPIPAGAGEPSTAMPTGLVAQAYPRGRGGTTSASFTDDGDRGLSPRARGNRQHYRPLP